MSAPPSATSYRLLKGANTLAYLGLLLITWRLLAGELHWRLAVGATVVSGGWLAITYLRMQYLLKTYFDVLSRLEFLAPCVLGVALALFALLGPHHAAIRSFAALELAVWAWLVLRYRRNRVRYMRQGHGPLPRGAWVSPPAAMLEPGDLILTSGRIASDIRESVGHGETVLRGPDGSLECFTSLMDTGPCLRAAEEFTNDVRLHGHYVVLRLREPLGPERAEHGSRIAREMIAESRRWCDAAERRRLRWIALLPLPEAWKQRLRALAHPTGYDWFGLFMGRLAPHRWTCVGACLELYRRLDVPMRPYGTGLLGFGTTLLDPIMPIRFLSDPAFHLLVREEAKASLASDRDA